MPCKNLRPYIAYVTLYSVCPHILTADSYAADSINFLFVLFGFALLISDASEVLNVHGCEFHFNWILFYSRWAGTQFIYLLLSLCNRKKDSVLEVCNTCHCKHTWLIYLLLVFVKYAQKEKEKDFMLEVCNTYRCKQTWLENLLLRLWNIRRKKESKIGWMIEVCNNCRCKQAYTGCKGYSPLVLAKHPVTFQCLSPGHARSSPR